MIDKRGILITLINECKIKDFSILGSLNNSINKENLQEFLLEKGFNDNNIYFYPAANEKNNICCIVVNNILSEKDLTEIESVFKVIYNYYQVGLTENIVRIMFGISNEKIKIKEIFDLLGIANKEISKLIFKSKQTVTDITKERTSITLSSLSILMKRFPLMPWDFYLIGF